MTIEAGTSRAVKYGAYPVIALASTLTLEQGEKQSLAQALHGIKHQFHVSNTMLGGLAAAMVLVGVVGGMPIGALADRWKRGTLLVIAMVIWTTCMGLGAIAPGFALLFITRLGVGAVEANGPASFSLMSDFYAVERRARMMGRYQLGGALGGLLGLGLAGVLVDNFGWRSAFWMWIPFGVVSIALLSRLPEPKRGDQDRAFHFEETFFDEETPVDHSYDDASWMDVMRELVKIKSMWFGLMALTISGFLLSALGVWGIEYFKQQFHLSATKAGGFAAAIGAGAALGLILGGEIADWLLKRGVLNARVYVTSALSILATVFMLPGLLTHSLGLAALLMFFGSFCLTAPVAPSEALTSDVVPGELRGRASAIRSVVRALSALAPFFVGVVADHVSLATSLAAFTPTFAIGGIVMLFAAKTYPADLAAVGARARARG
jgi:predicted MFS family arabinose efflux permease